MLSLGKAGLGGPPHVLRGQPELRRAGVGEIDLVREGQHRSRIAGIDRLAKGVADLAGNGAVGAARHGGEGLSGADMSCESGRANIGERGRTLRFSGPRELAQGNLVARLNAVVALGDGENVELRLGFGAVLPGLLQFDGDPRVAILVEVAEHGGPEAGASLVAFALAPKLERNDDVAGGARAALALHTGNEALRGTSVNAS